MICLCHAVKTAAGDRVSGLRLSADGQSLVGRVAFSRYPLGWNLNGKVFDNSASPLDLVKS